MDISAQLYNFDAAKNILLFVAEDHLADFDWPTTSLKSAVEASGFTGKFGQIANWGFITEEKPRQIIVVGLGKSKDLCLEQVRKAFGKGLKEAEKLKLDSLTVAPWSYSVLAVDDVARALAETALLATYRFNNYLAEKEDSSLKSLQISYGEGQETSFAKALKLGQTLGETTNLARTLVNEPANTMTPKQLAAEAVRAGQEYGFSVEVLEEKAIEELDMKAFLAVGKASANKPRFIIMRYEGNPDQAEQKLGLVGKGLTFDSGGLSIKPAQGMGDMKSDMAGAAAVIGAMSAIAREQLPVNVVAVVAACENLISSTGYRPGDILGSMSGKTILIESTDAEGRLTLADAVHYIITKENVHTVVDVATLTGAAIVALGNVTTGVVTNDQELYGKLESASEKCGERVWQLPSFPEYKEQNKTPIADLKNTGGRGAGAITAGLFIEAFVQDKPWLHLDIAGTSFSSKASDYLTEGATGVGVRLLYHLAETFV